MADIVEMVRTGETDLGLIPYPGRSEELDFTGLFAYERVLITPLDHPLLNEEVVTFEQIAEWPLILRGGMTLTRSMLESEFKRRGASPMRYWWSWTGWTSSSGTSRSEWASP